MTDARGAVIEIVERRKDPDDGSVGASIIVPDEVRINGQALLASADHPIKVHEIEIKDRDCVLVTLTLFARRVTIAAEDPTPTAVDTDTVGSVRTDGQ